MQANTTEIRVATSAEQYQVVRLLFEAYERALGFSLEFQNFDEELEQLPGRYAAPGGCILLAYQGEQPVGCVALRSLAPGICEMKRLFVLPDARGLHVGRALAVVVIEQARALGYRKMRLDTIEALRQANALYAALGFQPIAAYCHNPFPDARFFERVL